MDSFLKYLRGGAVAGSQRAAPTTIAASACEGGAEVEDDASFFDLEFAVPGDETDADEERVEFNFAVAAGEEAEVVAVDDSSAVAVAPATSGEESGKKKKGDDDNSKVTEEEQAEVAAPPPNNAASSALPPRPAATTKFRVLLLKLRKPKVAVPALDGNGGAAAGSNPAAAAAAAAKTATNRFLIKFRVDETAPLVSLFTRDNSSRTSDAAVDSRAPAASQQQDASMTSEERRLLKEVVLKYLSKIKPLYVKVSRRYGDRLRFAGDETDAEPEAPSATQAAASPAQSETAPQPQPQPVVVACGVRAPRASVPAGLKQVCKRLGKSRSASSAVAAAPSPPPATPAPVGGSMQRRDDSLLQVQDGIQSAIAHCKRSFNAASKGCESPLLRSMTVAGDAARVGAADNSDGRDGA